MPERDWIGEAKFLRALAYFNLSAYGGVPLVLKQTTSLDGFEVPGIQLLTNVMNRLFQICKKLNLFFLAIDQLPEGYLGRATSVLAFSSVGKGI